MIQVAALDLEIRDTENPDGGFLTKALRTIVCKRCGKLIAKYFIGEYSTAYSKEMVIIEVRKLIYAHAFDSEMCVEWVDNDTKYGSNLWTIDTLRREKKIEPYSYVAPAKGGRPVGNQITGSEWEERMKQIMDESSVLSLGGRKYSTARENGAIADIIAAITRKSDPPKPEKKPKVVHSETTERMMTISFEATTDEDTH